jgi:hypothetical protein
VKLIPIASALCAVAAVFYCAYTRTYDFVGLVILLVFFAYFLNLKSEGRRDVSLPSPASVHAVRSPIWEVGKGLACLVAGAVGVVIGLHVPDVQIGVAIALTAAVAGIVAFMLFLLRAVTAR